MHSCFCYAISALSCSDASVGTPIVGRNYAGFFMFQDASQRAGVPTPASQRSYAGDSNQKGAKSESQRMYAQLPAFLRWDSTRIAQVRSLAYLRQAASVGTRNAAAANGSVVFRALVRVIIVILFSFQTFKYCRLGEEEEGGKRGTSVQNRIACIGLMMGFVARMSG